MHIIAIVVTYEPERNGLINLLSVLQSQVHAIVIVDNSVVFNIDTLVEDAQYQNIHYIRLKENFGIAYAQNIGIEYAINQQSSHFLLMDQDSTPYPNMVRHLSEALIASEQEQGHLPVAAVGPIHIDRRNGVEATFVVKKNGFLHKLKPSEHKNGNGYFEVMFLISSGMLIKASVIHDILGKRSDYFIDHVDTEWTFRALSKGYRLLTATAAKMEHAIGDSVKRIDFFGIRYVAYHSTFRHYYAMRNGILLFKDVKLSLIFKWYLAKSIFMHLVYFSLFANNRKQRVSAITMGLLHGFQNIRGKLDLVSKTCSKIPTSSIDGSHDASH